MARAAGFRNLLVHRYQTIDDDAVVGFLDHLDQLEQFVDGVLAWRIGKVTVSDFMEVHCIASQSA